MVKERTKTTKIEQKREREREHEQAPAHTRMRLEKGMARMDMAKMEKDKYSNAWSKRSINALAYAQWKNVTLNDENCSEFDLVYGRDSDSCEDPFLWELKLSKQRRGARSITNSSSSSSSSRTAMSYHYQHDRWQSSKRRALLCLLNVTGYFSAAECLHRLSYYSYLKASKASAIVACSDDFFGDIALSNPFRVELSLLCLHLWLVKERLLRRRERSGSGSVGGKLDPELRQWTVPALCAKAAGLGVGHERVESVELAVQEQQELVVWELYQIMFNELGFRFSDAISGSLSHWELQCQQLCLHLSFLLDQAAAVADRDDPDHFVDALSQTELNVDQESLRRLSDYIHRQMLELDRVDDFHFLNGWWSFDLSRNFRR